MEQTQQRVNHDGLQIPQPFITQYGLHPGSEVTVELDDDMIRIIPKYPTQADIEQQALCLLLNSLGDAVLIKAQQLDATEPSRKRGDWRVYIYARGFDDALGYLDYAPNGQILSDLDSVLAKIRQNAIHLLADLCTNGSGFPGA